MKKDADGTRDRVFRQIKGAGAALLWLGAWSLVSLLAGRRLFLASPWETASAFVRLCGARAFWGAVFGSFLRVTAGFAAAFCAGVVLVSAAYRIKALRTLLSPLMTALKSVPVASFIILALIVAGSRGIAVLISFVTALPVVYGTLGEGFGALDRSLFDVADVYGMSAATRLRFIYLPELMPQLRAAGLAGIGLAWKSGIAAEVLGVTAGSLGGMLYDSKVNLATDELFACTLAAVLLSALCEKLFRALSDAVLKRVCGG